MFYINGGGALNKKKIINDIFRLDNVKHEDNNARSDDRDDSSLQEAGSRSRSRSRSRSQSRHSNKIEGDDTETDTNSEDNYTDTSSISHPDEKNNDYVVTLGSSNTSKVHHHYDFVENELDYDIEEFSEQHPEIKHYEMMIYQINTSCSSAFLEFLFYYENSLCKLPYYKHTIKRHIRKELDNIMKQLFTSKYRYKGYLHDELTGKCYVFYEKYFREDKILPQLLSLRHSHSWYWLCTTEIIYQKRYMSLEIDEDAIDLFNSYPLIGILQATIPFEDVLVRDRRAGKDNGDRFQSVNIEAPTILYYGSSLCYAENTALYGLKREPLTARFGPFYYFTSLDYAYYWACYHNTSKRNTVKERNNDGCISRYALFTRRMKTVFADDDYDVEMVKKYVERKNMFETKINEYRQTQEDYHHDMYDSIYSHDYTWTSTYDTIYNGLYDTKKLIRPIWSVCDHRNFKLLSYYQVDTTDIPHKYDHSYVDYKLM